MNPGKTDRLKHRLEAVLCSRKRSETTPAEGPRYLPMGGLEFSGFTYGFYSRDDYHGFWGSIVVLVLKALWETALGCSYPGLRV